MFFSGQIKGLLVSLVVPCALVACGGGGGGGGGTSVAVVSSAAPNANSSVASSVDGSLSSPSSVASSQSSIPVVIISDTTPPVLSLSGVANIEINHGSVYLDGGATAHDAVDGELPVTISGLVDTSVLGEYTLTYSATDASGNVGSVSRVVTVVDAQSPVITLEGGEAVTVYVGDAYLDGGATAHDAVDGELPITISGLVDTSVLGEYTLTYSATDASGNVGSVSRVVMVKSLDYGFQFVDKGLTLWEGSYQHTFELVFDQTESKERTLNVSIADASTASEGVDFDVVSSMVLAFDVGDSHSETLVELSDATIAGESHASLSTGYVSPMAVLMGDKLLVNGTNQYEEYDLLTESTSEARQGYFYIALAFGDAVAYQNNIYVFSAGKLYRNNAWGFELISESPWFMEWNSELQVLNGELYVVAGRTDVENATTQVAIYNFQSGQWRLGAPLNHIRYGASTAVVDGKIYVFGGNYGGQSAEVLDSAANSWSYIPGHSSLGASFDTAVASGKYIDVVVSALSTAAKVSAAPTTPLTLSA